MKAQAREEKTRRQLERARLLREKELREEAEKERAALEFQLMRAQEEAHVTQEALRRNEETTELLTEKARLAEEEAMLLSQKAAEAEAEIQRVKISAIKTEEEKHVIERKAQEAELLATRIVQESDRKAKEADQLRDELFKAKVSEQQAKEKLVCVLKSIHHSSANGSSLPSHHMHSKNNSVIISTPSLNGNDRDVLLGAAITPDMTQSSVSSGRNMGLSGQSVDYMGTAGSNAYANNKSWCSMDATGKRQPSLVSITIPDALSYVGSSANSPCSNGSNSTRSLVPEASQLRVVGEHLRQETNGTNLDDASIYSNLDSLRLSPFKQHLNYLNSLNGASFTSNYPQENVLNSANSSFSGKSLVTENLEDQMGLDENSHSFVNSLTESDLEKLESEVEKERMEYLQKSKHLQEQLKDLKSEIQVLKVAENMTDLDRIYEENVDKGETKYSTLKRTRSGTTRARVFLLEDL